MLPKEDRCKPGSGHRKHCPLLRRRARISSLLIRPLDRPLVPENRDGSSRRPSPFVPCEERFSKGYLSLLYTSDAADE